MQELIQKIQDNHGLSTEQSIGVLNTIKDYNRFLEISLGSSFELETQLLITKAVHPDSDHIVIDSTLSKIDEEQKMLMAFMRKINS